MALCFLQHENEIRLPELVKYGGTIAFQDEFSLKWIYLKLFLLKLTGLLYIVCCVFYSMEYGFVWWFSYYGYLNFLFFFIYCSLSFAITLHIYRYIKNAELPFCLKSPQSIQVHDQLSGQEDQEDVSSRNNYDHRHQRSLDSLDMKMGAFYRNISLSQLDVHSLGWAVTVFYYISLIGLWSNALLFWIHEFETAVFEQQSIKMRFIVMIVNVVMPILALIEFGCSGFQIKYKGAILPMMMMILVMIINLIQIMNDGLDEDGEWDQHLFTELNWKSNSDGSIVVCIWCLCVAVICNFVATFFKNICLCRWTAKQRRGQNYPHAQESAVEMDI